YREHLPASILVLPPTNQSLEVNASYSVLSSVTTPLAAAGYYVFPVAVVDTYFKENGLPTPAEMHSVPLDKLKEVFGADAVLYLDVNEYGQDYNIVSSAASVDVDAKLVDTATGLTIWDGRAAASDSSSNGNSGGGLLGLLATAALAQAIGTTVDASHGVAVQANQQMILGRDGLLLGPYHEGQTADLRGLPPAAAAEAAGPAEAAEATAPAEATP
ncbi:MAG: DUF799 domain-containing protein, partial [Alphaproteobacteria bacterium]|nr:DUF799 domain-containing protein [Alphaproteobacteria bacterium]